MSIEKAKREFLVFFKYGVVGVSGTIIDVAALWLLVEFVPFFENRILLAASLSFVLAVVNNFWWNKHWTFQDRSKNYRKQFIKFLIIALIGLLLTNISMYLFVEVLLIWYIFAKLMTSAVVMLWNFLGNKMWTFKAKDLSIKIPKKFEHDLTIVYPAYNEERRIKDTLILTDNFIRKNKINAEIIVVSDGSKDGTNKVINSLQKEIKNLKFIEYFPNRGKGFAVRTGVENALGKTILFSDADNSTPIEEYLKLREEIKKNEVVIGSRYVKNSDIKIKQPLYRRFISRVGNFLIQAFLVDGVSDTQCGFKLFQHVPAKKIFGRQKINGFGFDMELLTIAKSLDYKIKEVPVSWYNSADSRVRPVRDGIKTLFELILIKLNLWSGRYR